MNSEPESSRGDRDPHHDLDPRLDPLLDPRLDPLLDPYEGGTLGAGINWADPNSPLAPLYLTSSGVLAVLLLALTFLLLAAVPLGQTDFWAHLKYGEWIVAHQALPTFEPLCPFTDHQTRMFDAMWLTQVVYHELFRLGQTSAGGDVRRQFEGGVEIERLVHAFTAVLALGLLGLAYRRQAGSVPWAIGGIVLVLVFLLSNLAIQRPQLFGFTCFAALLWTLSRPSWSRRMLIGLPLLMILWANLHGSFVVGFALMSLVLAGRAVEVAQQADGSVRAVGQDESTQRFALAVVLALVGVSVLNPYGVAIFANVLRFGGHPNLATMAEWQPLDFSQPRGGHWGYLAILALLALVQLASPRPLSLTQVLLLLTFGVWPLFQQRTMIWWVPLVPWLVAPHAAAITQPWGWQGPVSIPSFRKTALAGLLVAVALFLSPLSSWLKTGRPRSTQVALARGTPNDIAAALSGQPVVDQDRVAALVQVIREQHGGRYIGRVFSSEIQGEYLLWALPDDTPVMMFNHAQLFPPAYWNECLHVKNGDRDWWEILDRSGAGVVVVERDLHPELCAELRTAPHWQVVLDEQNIPARDLLSRLFVAVKRPVVEAGKVP
jgi:hypothetical protein